jgi:diaminopimelate decarboxylase/aspartate kinase
MWGHAGFLARVFAPFAAHGVSVDLIATSQYAVSLTLDHIPDGPGGQPLRRVLAELGAFCATAVRSPCAVVSVVGRALRNALPRLGAAMSALEGIPVYLVTEAAEDLNLSFVVDECHADDLVARLHGELLENDAVGCDPQFGPIWTEMPCGRKQEDARKAASGAAATP